MIPLFHRDFGGAGKPPLLLLHGLLGSSRNWQSAGADFSSIFHVFALDLRNHGRSPHSPEMTYEAMVEDVLAWMEAHALPCVTTLGHSMGGKVAMLLASRHPARVERLVVVDIAPKDYLSEAHRGEFAAMNELDLRTVESRGAAEMRFEARVPDWAMRKFLTTNLERDEAGAWKWIVNLPILSKSLPFLEKSPLSETDAFTGPALWIAGEKSRYVLADDWPGILKHFPAACGETVTGAGHNPHIEKRSEFVGAVLSWAKGAK